MPSRPLSPPAASAWRSRRRTVLALVLAAVILIPAARIYRAQRGAAGGARESAAVSVKTASGPASKAASASAAPPPEARPESAARAGVDASNFYKDAFVLYDKLTEEEQNMFWWPPEKTDAEQKAALFKKIQPILELLRQGADADYCEWGLGSLTIDTNLSHLGRSAVLGKLAVWSANYRFPSDPQGALGDLKAQARLAAHLVDSEVGWAIQMTMERRGNEVLRENADLLDEAGLSQAQELLRSSTVEQNMKRAFTANAASYDFTAQKISALTPSERGEYLLNSLSGRPASEALKQLFQNETALSAELHYFQQMDMEMAEAMLWPEAEYQAWWSRVKSSLPDHPMAEEWYPTQRADPPMYERHQQSQVERALLDAGLTLLQGGPAQRAQFRDPVGGAAFSYVEKPDGFELQSAFKKNGKPVTMSFTRR